MGVIEKTKVIEEKELVANRWPHTYKKEKQQWFRHKPLVSKTSANLIDRTKGKSRIKTKGYHIRNMSGEDPIQV